MVSLLIENVLNINPEKCIRIVLKKIFKSLEINMGSECPSGGMVKMLNCGIIVSKFKLQSHYYVTFQTNTLRKRMNPLILPAMG